MKRILIMVLLIVSISAIFCIGAASTVKAENNEVEAV